MSAMRWFILIGAFASCTPPVPTPARAATRAEADGGPPISPRRQSGMQYLDGGRVYYVPGDGFVPDAQTAIKIAEAVWIPIYGQEMIESERPFRAELKNDVWFVEGSMECKNCVGGVAEAEISRTDGRIIRVIHGK